MVATEQEAKRKDVIVLKPLHEEGIKWIYPMTLYNEKSTSRKKGGTFC